MGKIDNLEKYIAECDNLVNSTSKERENFIEKMVGVYGNEIKNITNGLNLYYSSTPDDYLSDVENIKVRLINHKDNLELEEQRRKEDLELARLKQGNISVSANANNSNNVNINISLDQAIDTISKIPDEIMTKHEKEDLEDKLSGIDIAVKSGKKEKAKEKIGAVLKFVADKGVDALIAVLPYLGQMAGIIGN